MKLIVNPHKIELIQEEAVNEKEIDISKCEFEFADEITDNYVKEAYFTLGDETYKKIIVNNQCSFPQEVLVKPATIELGVVAYLVESDEEIKRYNPTPVYFKTDLGSLKTAENSQEPTPSEMEQYEQALQDGLSEVNDKLDAMDTALAEVDNLDIDASKSGTVSTVTITNKSGTTKSVEIIDGVNGTDGRDGQDGITPTIGDNGNWYLGTTDTGKPSRGETGQAGATGQQGPAGNDGADGFSPIASISKSGSTATISITDKNGTTTATVSDGTNGQDGVGVPSGGTQGQILSKNSATNYDTTWIDAPNPDLSNYYTKAEVNGINLPIYTFIASSFGWGSNAYTLTSSDKTNLATILNNAKTNGHTVIGILLRSQSDVELPDLLIPKTIYANIQTNPTAMTFVYTFGNSDGTVRVTEMSIVIRWNNNVASVTSGSIRTYYPQFLARDNTSSYTPSEDYNPATKKYVDDSLANIPASNYLGYIEDYTSSNRLDITNLEKGTYLIAEKTNNWTTQDIYFKATYDNVERTYTMSIDKTGPLIGNMLFLNVTNPMSTFSGYDEAFTISFHTIYPATNKITTKIYKVNFNANTGAFSAGSVSENVINVTTTDTEQTISAKKTFTTLPESSVAPTTANQLTNKTYVDSKSMQVSTMPTASADTVGKIVEYTGTSDGTYTNGYFYIGTSTTESDVTTYSWEQLNVQPDTGLHLFEVANTSVSIDLLGLKKGVYLLTKKSTAVKYSPYATEGSMTYIVPIDGKFYITRDITSGLANNTVVGYFWGDAGGNYPMNLIKISTTGSGLSTNGEAYNNGIYLVTRNYPETIYSKKTFTVLPETTLTPSNDSQFTNKSYVDSVASPIVTTNSDSTYTIASLIGNQSYKLGEITALTITAVTTFDKETIIYFDSGSTATTISIPDSLTNLGDVPTLTTASNVSTGTCEASKSYIIAVLNNIAVWKAY